MSTKFQLKSDYQPMGDQPAAIAQLTEGLEKDVKEQVLLGVTGSGKSVVGLTKVFVKNNDKIYHTSIANLGRIFPHEIGADNITQVATLGNALQTLAVKLSDGQVRYGQVTEISRHTYTGDIFKVVTACGRINEFTDSHNVYIMRQGNLCLLPSSELQTGDRLPIPVTIPSGTKGIQHIDTREWLPEDTWYVSVTDDETLIGSQISSAKRWRIKNKGERLEFKQHLALAISPSSMDRVGPKMLAATIPVMLRPNRTLWRFIGLFIAEGHSEPGYIVLTTADVSVAEEFNNSAKYFGLNLRKRSYKYDYVLYGKTLAGLMKSWCGASAKKKHLPAFWPQCSDDQLGQLLSGIFAGDGWVEPGEVCLASVSQELVGDVQCSLLRFGIHARIREKLVLYKGGRRPAWILSINGKASLAAFEEHIGFGLQRKDDKLASILDRELIPNTNVDLLPWDADDINKLRLKYKLRQKDLAITASKSRALIGLYLSGQRLPSRAAARRILELLKLHAQLAGDTQIVSSLDQQINQTNLFWTPIKSIEKKRVNCEVVYDLSVPLYETFFAGQGGYFVHNTFTMANVIQNRQKPTLVLSHNKTLAAQLYSEFKNFFPNNAVHYFVSYFDYYQPEAYIPRSDTYIEKDSQINEEIDRLRHAATDSLLTRRDVIIVASVSCIYGIGSVEDYDGLSIDIRRGERRVRDKMLRQLTDIQYQRNDIDFHRGVFRVRGDVVDIFPAGEELAYRVEFFGDEIDRITQIDPLTGEILQNRDELKVFPSSHYVTPQDKLKVALGKIEQELDQRLHEFKTHGKLLEAQRLEQRTRFDLEMLEETGFVKGIENYSRYLTNREPGEQPATLLDYFPDDYLLFVDESHMTIPQVRGMYNGDRARKEVLVEHGFRLPSALDNRPLTFSEYERHVNKVVYVSATPAQYELSRSAEPVRQLIRPTGLLDPQIEVRPIEGQIDDLINEIKATIDKHQRVLVTTLTKRMSEDLTEYLKEINIKVTYLHSDVDTLDRTDILRDLRLGTYDVVVGINLLREGLDLPEVSLVAILDADKEGFLRSEQALIQTVGRAARHVEGHVVMYADRVTNSMQRTIDETARRREIQEAYNKEHGITPTGISKAVEKGMRPDLPEEAKRAKLDLKKIPRDEYGHLIRDLTSQMDLAAANLEFEKAAELRDIINDIKSKV